MVDEKVLIGYSTGEAVRRPDFYNHLYQMAQHHKNALIASSHDRSPAHGRNTVIENAIAMGCSRVLLVDDDQTFDDNALLKLLEHDVDCVSGLYLTRKYPHPPLVFDIADDDGSCMPMYLLGDEQRLVPIVSCGFGFCLFKTYIFKYLEKPWIRLGELDPQEWCDDMGFFKRFREAGFKAFCDMEVTVGHIGEVVIRPVRKDGVWYTIYNTGGEGQILTPQIVPKMVTK